MTYDRLKAELQAARREGRHASVEVTDLPDDLAEAYRLAFGLIPPPSFPTPPRRRSPDRSSTAPVPV